MGDSQPTHRDELMHSVIYMNYINDELKNIKSHFHNTLKH